MSEDSVKTGPSESARSLECMEPFIDETSQEYGESVSPTQLSSIPEVGATCDAIEEISESVLIPIAPESELTGSSKTMTFGYTAERKEESVVDAEGRDPRQSADVPEKEIERLRRLGTIVTRESSTTNPIFDPPWNISGVLDKYEIPDIIRERLSKYLYFTLISIYTKYNSVNVY